MKANKQEDNESEFKLPRVLPEVEFQETYNSVFAAEQALRDMVDEKLNPFCNDKTFFGIYKKLFKIINDTY